MVPLHRRLAGVALIALGVVAAPLRAEPVASSTAAHQPASDPAAEAAGGTPRRHRILIMDLTPVGVETTLVTVLGGLITDAVARYPNLQTISTSDIRNLVELETGKQQVGCDSNSCLAEVAGAMGAEFVIFGNVGMLGSTTVVQLSLFDAAKAQAVARHSIKASSHDALATAVEPAVAELLRELIPADQRPVAVPPAPAPAAAAPTSGNDLGWLMWTGAVVGALSGITLLGAYFGGILIADQSGAPGEYVQLMTIPVVGPALSAEKLSREIRDNQSSGDSGPPAEMVALSYAWSGGEALLALGTVGGLGMFALGKALDGPGLSLGGQLWQWGLLALGGGLVASGLTADLAMDESHDHELGPTDLIGPGCYALAALAVGTGLFLNPFGAEAE